VIPSTPETCWPTPEQELLLKAALLKGEEAVLAWRELTAAIDHDDLDAGARRLLPLVWHNLSGREGLKDDVSLGESRAAYRQTLTENTFRLHQAGLFLRELQEVGCPAILLKGLALIVRGYPDRGLRPMGDFDVLIPEERREEVVALLQDADWVPSYRGPEKFTAPYREVVHAHSFTSEANWCVDLHWHAMEECVWPGADDDFWEGAVAVDLEGVPVAVLNPADQLLHLCVHGVKCESIPTLRWVADAFIVMKDAAGTLDWDRLVEQATRRTLTLPVTEALRYLVTLLDAPVPGAVLKRLAAVDVPGRERREFRRRTREGSSRTFGFLPTLWYKHSRMEGGAHLLRKAWGFPDFIRKYWGMENWRELLSFLARASARKRRRITR